MRNCNLTAFLSEIQAPNRFLLLGAKIEVALSRSDLGASIKLIQVK